MLQTSLSYLFTLLSSLTMFQVVMLYLTIFLTLSHLHELSSNCLLHHCDVVNTSHDFATCPLTICFIIVTLQTLVTASHLFSCLLMLTCDHVNVDLCDFIAILLNYLLTLVTLKMIFFLICNLAKSFRFFWSLHHYFFVKLTSSIHDKVKLSILPLVPPSLAYSIVSHWHSQPCTNLHFFYFTTSHN